MEAVGADAMEAALAIPAGPPRTHPLQRITVIMQNLYF